MGGCEKRKKGKRNGSVKGLECLRFLLCFCMCGKGGGISNRGEETYATGAIFFSFCTPKRGDSRKYREEKGEKGETKQDTKGEIELMERERKDVYPPHPNSFI
ncbi:hypothetical protein, unlikely [Trypanosoma brucei gambiense DAL972]|uniref:Uncharacterized protein n=1 Tax=Trypanosoma brucei gambiense (strain MHOM/CI/86/DAL972) TaxID=679716 RepID=C9ZTI3_TRYB9|nr:hypothetical protein, unlikely [Trypanosoma brucei gambiense DAL972]CBH12718.1 hypothetical protein, unlikely [Trypanosoma brucei gambiense DAL972]|eukprot:XP_011774998.1 hypothetical protein, unlikely [Trypanosoma brucei gambiense DAL972]